MEVLGVQLPPYHTEGDLIKYTQGWGWNIEKAAAGLSNTLQWLEAPPKTRLTPLSVKLLNSGAFYILGRDKFYRPTFVMDVEAMARLTIEDPAIVTVEVFTDLFTFLWEYVTRVMLLPGQIVQWVTIINMGNLGINAIPRDLIMGFGKVCSAHCLYYMKKCYYLRVSWAQRMLYKGIKWMIHPETIEKYVITSDASTQELLD